MASSVVSHLTIPLALCWRVGSYLHGRGVGDISIGEVKGYVRGLRCLKLGAERHSQAPVDKPWLFKPAIPYLWGLLAFWMNLTLDVVYCSNKSSESFLRTH